MFNNVNHRIRPFLVAAIILGIGWLLFFCFGCNTAKQIERREDKSLGIVQGSPRVFPKAGQAWLDIHPCLIDSKTIHDTITNRDTVKIEKKIFIPQMLFKNQVIDTIMEGISIYADSTGITVKNLNEVVTNTRTVTVKQIDQTRVNNLTDSIHSKEKELAFHAGQNEILQASIKQQGQTITKLWIAMAIAGAFILLLTYFSLKSFITKIPGLVSGAITKIKS